MHDDRWDRFEDPWGGRVPFMRRPWVRRVLVVIAAGSFLLLTLMSTCAPGRRAPTEPTTTTGVTL